MLVRVPMRPLVAALLLSALAFGCSEEPVAEGPDVLLLVVDTLRADHLSTYGYQRETAPALDRFAERALVFRDVTAPASWTLPSTASLLTSTYASVHGLRARTGAPSRLSMRTGVQTLAEILRTAGYRTVAIVANPWVISKKHGLRRGFETFHTMKGSDAEALDQLAQRELERDDPRPIFLYVHYMDVHGPYPKSGPKDDYEAIGPLEKRYVRGLSKQERTKIPSYLRIQGTRRLARYVRAYDQGIRNWDAAFGRFVDWLDERGRLDGAITAIVADHGEELLEHGGWNHGKTLYQEQLAVPWLLVAPGVAAGVRDDPVSLVDVAPTLLGLLGYAPPVPCQGVDVLASPNADRTVYSETEKAFGPGGEVQRAMRRGERKWVSDGAGGRCYDLERDPDELAAEPFGDCAEGLRALDAWLAHSEEVGKTLGTQQAFERSDAEREELRELGYLQ